MPQMNIKLNTKGIIISSKDKNYINDNLFTQTEGKNSPLCYVITSGKIVVETKFVVFQIYRKFLKTENEK
jgi:hypothetical protein